MKREWRGAGVVSLLLVWTWRDERRTKAANP